MKLFLSYLKSKIRLLLMLLLSTGMLTAVLLLYGAPLEGALYGLLLCAILGLGFLTAGFLRYRRKHRALQAALRGRGGASGATCPSRSPVAQSVRAPH